MAHDLFRLPSIGFGHDTGDLPALRRALAWWQRHPKLAATRRGQERIAALTRDIARHLDSQSC